MTILEEAQEEMEEEASRMHLGEADRSAIDLAGFGEHLEHGSGRAPQAGSLLTLMRGGQPRRELRAAGWWDGDGGIIDVGHLDTKLKLAYDWGAREVFVPENARYARIAGLVVGTLHAGLRDPADALRDYLAALDAPPLPDAPRDKRRQFYLRQMPRSGRAFDYYRESLRGNFLSKVDLLRKILAYIDYYDLYKAPLCLDVCREAVGKRTKEQWVIIKVNF
jgi:hypothetical protein